MTAETYMPLSGVTAQPEVTESVAAPSPAGGKAAAPLPGWFIPAILLLIAAAAAVVARLILRRRRAVTNTSAPVVGKLHEQGARDSQQDSFSVSPAELAGTHGLLAAVADGMGGLSDGDRVSQAAVTSVMERFIYDDAAGITPEESLLRLLSSANSSVNKLLGYSRIGQSGSTLLLGLLKDGYFYFLSVGDSRIYLYRSGSLLQLNREHIYRRELELLAVNGDGSIAEAASHPRAAGLTSYLGMGKLKYVDICDAPVAVMAGDRFVLMTDGVYNALSDAELKAALDNGAQAAADAIGAAVESHAWPGQDNYTAVVIQC